MNEMQPGSGSRVRGRHARVALLVTAIMLILGTARAPLVRADVSLTAANVLGAPGSTVTLAVAIASTGGSLPSALNFDLVFDSTRLSVSPEGVTCSTACWDAQKFAAAALVEPGRLRVIVYGGTAAIHDGELVGVPFAIAAGATTGLARVEGANEVVSDASAALVPSSFADGSICIGDSPAACAACGNGGMDSGEECDDGNNVGGDGCSVACSVESGWTCSGQPSVCSVATTTTTTATTSTTSTTAEPSTTTTSASSTTSITGPTSTTSTSTSTSTTMPPVACDGIPDDATFASLRCRIDELLARVNGETGLGHFQPKLAGQLERAGDRLDEAQTRCAESNAKKARKRLQQTRKALSQYVHRLGSLAARNKLDQALRLDFQSAGEAIMPDVETLRTTLECPGDATALPKVEG